MQLVFSCTSQHFYTQIIKTYGLLAFYPILKLILLFGFPSFSLDTINKMQYFDEAEKQKVRACYDAIPKQLAKELKKFQYSTVEKGSTSKKYADSIQWQELLLSEGQRYLHDDRASDGRDSFRSGHSHMPCRDCCLESDRCRVRLPHRDQVGERHYSELSLNRESYSPL